MTPRSVWSDLKHTKSTPKVGDYPPIRAIPNPVAAGGVSKKSLRWTEDQDAALRDFYSCLAIGGITLPEIAAHFGKTVYACSIRAGRLGCSTPRGKHLRPPSPPREPKPRKYATQAERSRAASERMTARHATTPHPMKGKIHSPEIRQKISDATRGKQVPPERTARQLATRFARYGTLANNNVHGSWKAGWREIGGTRIYARSRWEANYARYLQFLLSLGEILKWEHEPETFWFDKIKRGCRSYLPDFRVVQKDGAVEYHEVKGWMDARSKTKLKRMKKYHPKITMILRDTRWFKANSRRIAPLIPDWESSTGSSQK